MKKHILALAAALLLLVLIAGTVLAKGGARNGIFVRFDQLGFVPGYYAYCEGYFLEAANGIVHEWRDNPECKYHPDMTATALHLVFKPVAQFPVADCDDAGLFVQVPNPWTLNSTYVDLDEDDADLRDFFGQDGERYYWVCMYHMDP